MAVDVYDIILDMKNKSELMIDLAYSALLYNNKDLAEEVMQLELDVDSMTAQVQKAAIAQCLDDKMIERALVIIKLATSIEAVADAAVEIADVVIKGLKLPDVFQISVMESQIVFDRFVVENGCALAGKSIGEAQLASNTGMWVIAIKRGKTWLYGPDENTKMMAGDVLYARGPIEGEEKLRRLCRRA